MACRLGVCGCSPYTLILGMLSIGPASPSELVSLANTVYGDGASCWSVEDYRVVLGFLLHSGMVRLEEDGRLHLHLGDPHDREYAETARRALVEAGLVSGVAVDGFFVPCERVERVYRGDVDVDVFDVADSVEVQLERDGGRVLAFLHYYVDSVEDGGLLGKHGYYVDPERCEVMEE